MNNKLKNMPISLISTTAILLLLIMLMSNAPATLGRYMSSVDGDVVLFFNSKQNFKLSYGEWEENEGKQTLLISINNAPNVNASLQGGAVRIRLYMPKIDGLKNVRLGVEGYEYISKISEVAEGTVAHKQYGDGNICRFYGDDGEEICFDFPISRVESLDATLTLTADIPVDTTGIQVIVDPINTKGNGGN